MFSSVTTSHALQIYQDNGRYQLRVIEGMNNTYAN